jgi:hypothetical protein
MTSQLRVLFALPREEVPVRWVFSTSGGLFEPTTEGDLALKKADKGQKVLGSGRTAIQSPGFAVLLVCFATDTGRTQAAAPSVR